MSDQLNLKDPQIRRMAEENHTPSEQWLWSGKLAAVYCEKCGQSWPCPTVEALRVREREAEGFETGGTI